MAQDNWGKVQGPTTISAIHDFHDSGTVSVLEFGA
jgi:hypothetical protein